MSILTGAGMKMVLPAVLAGLSETAWRSKQVCMCGGGVPATAPPT